MATATKASLYRDCPLSVSIASHDLPPTESQLQTFNALENLTQNVNEIFGRLNSRISQERTKLHGIQERILQCDAKVKYVGQNPSNVCTVYSSATFPAAAAPPLFNKIIADRDETLPNPISMVNYKLSEQQRFRSSEKVNTNELFMKMTRASLTRTDRTIRNDTGKEGLGRFPTNLTSTSSVILFNSEENPYKNYDSFNNLESVADVRQKIQVSKSLADAPTTIADGLELPGFSSLQFDYRPDMGILPTFALPTSLGLKNVANISFDNQSILASIAPSLTSVPDLPSFGVAQQSIQQNRRAAGKKGATLQTVSAAPAIAPPPAVAPPPAAVAPQPIAAPQQQQYAPQAQQQLAPTTAVPAQMAAPQQAVLPTVAAAPKPIVPANPGHGSLLDSIRQGLKLKKVDEADSSTSSRPPPQKPQDLQSVLFAGIQRHAALMNGRDVEKKTSSKPQDSLSGKFDSSIQKRLVQQETDSDNETTDDDWGS